MLAQHDTRIPNVVSGNNPQSASDNSGWVPIVLVLLITFIAYSGTLWFQFVYDDRGQILANPQVHYWRYAPHFFGDRVWSFAYPTVLGNYYRPIFMLWLLINYKVFGPYPAGWHLTTVGVHSAVTFLVYLLARRVLGDSRTAVIAALIFGLTPVHIESVAWISGVTDPLLALFLIPSFLCYLNWRDRKDHARLWLAASLLLYALAALSKETAVILPLIVFAYEWLWRPVSEGLSPWRAAFARLWRSLLRAAPMIAVTIVYLAVRWRVLQGLGHDMTPLAISTIVFTWPQILWLYLKHLIWPVGLSVFYDIPYVVRPGLRTFFLPAAGLALIALVIAVWLRRLLRKSPTSARTVAFALVWIVLPFVPLLDLSVLPVGEIAHDRYLYLPTIGFSILAAMAIRRLNVGRSTLFGLPAAQAAVALGLALALGIGTALQDLYWANDVLLYSRGVAMVPRNKLARTNLGNALGELGHYRQALELYREVLAQDPRFWLATYNMGYTCYRMGRLQGAEDYFRRAIAINAVDGDEYLYLGLTWLKLGRCDEAEKAIRRAVQLNPNGLGYHFAMGMVLKLDGNLEGALQEFRRELSNFPEESGAMQQIQSIRAELAQHARGEGPPKERDSKQ
jgi:protein O-mannosyl-transferase